eukprot:158690-Prorocentrum_minimum.AAC.1
MAVCRQGIYVEYSVEYSKCCAALNGISVSLFERPGAFHGPHLVHELLVHEAQPDSARAVVRPRRVGALRIARLEERHIRQTHE